MKNIFIFGGSFDPIHNGHFALIEKICILADEVWIVPSGKHPEAKQFLFSDQERLLMLQSSLKDLPSTRAKIYIKEEELFQKTPAYTIETLRLFQKQESQAHWNLVVGADQAQKFGTWKNSEEIAKRVDLWTVAREDFIPDKRFSWNCIPFSLMPVSSTQIREALLGGQDYSQFIPASVFVLIQNFFDKKSQNNIF